MIFINFLSLLLERIISSGTSTSSKYVPPSLRRDGSSTGGRNVSGGDAPPRGDRDRNDDATVRVSNLSPDVDEQDVRDLFGRFGGIRRVFLVREQDTNLCRGFGFVSYYDESDAKAAIKGLNGYGYDSLILRVETPR
jgi:translation initiation factor 3 subunit G